MTIKIVALVLMDSMAALGAVGPGSSPGCDLLFLTFGCLYCRFIVYEALTDLQCRVARKIKIIRCRVCDSVDQK